MTVKEFLTETFETFWHSIILGVGFSFGVFLFFLLFAV